MMKAVESLELRVESWRDSGFAAFAPAETRRGRRVPSFQTAQEAGA